MISDLLEQHEEQEASIHEFENRIGKKVNAAIESVLREMGCKDLVKEIYVDIYPVSGIGCKTKHVITNVSVKLI